MPIFGRRHLRSILASVRGLLQRTTTHRSRQLHPPGLTTLPPTSPRSGSSADPSSAALSTNTSGPHRSHGQGRWPSSGPHRTVLQRSGFVVWSRVRRACSTRRFSGSSSLRVSRSSAKGSTSSGSPAWMARSQRHRRGLNIRPVRPAPATTAYGLVQAWDRQRMTSWRQPDGARMACCRRRAIPGIAAPGAIVVPNRHRRIASPASRCCAHRPCPGSRAGNPAALRGTGLATSTGAGS